MLDPLYTAVSWVLLRWYQLFTTLGMAKESGLTWALSIVMLVVTARLLLFRFFVKQVHYQRKMQEMQPLMAKLKEKHKGDKAALQREMMKLQQEEGFNPISGCLPMFLQIPVFISLFHVLKHMSNSIGLKPGDRGLSLYGFTETQTIDAAHAKLFGAPLAATLRESADKITQLGGHVTTTRSVTLVLVIVSALATLITQRAVIANQTTPAEGQAAMIQKLMLVGIPLSVVFSGVIFPLGVLLYWFTSNLWTMGQQFYIFRFHPHTPAGSGDTPASTNEVGRSLAPKVGAKPITGKGTRTGAVVQSNTAPDPVTANRANGKPDATAKTVASSKQPTTPTTGDLTGSATTAGSATKNGASSAGGAAKKSANRAKPAGTGAGNVNRPAAKRAPGKKRR
ncbi:MAG: rane protein insertase YidC [Frankiales bacterium]|nr:rane protein insertase YidC [Frankiales bacterium]